MKRILCIVVALSLLISLFTVTALADSALPTTGKQLDLFNFIPFFTFESGNYFYDSTEPVFSYMLESEIDSFLVRFGSGHSAVPPLYYQRVYLIFSTPIDDVFWDIYLYGDFEYPIAADYIDDFHQYGIQYYIYSFDIGQELSTLYYLEILMDIPYANFDFTIHEFYSDIGSRAIYSTYGFLTVEGTVQQEGEGYYNQIFYQGNQEFPVQYDVTFTKPSGPADDYLTAYLEFHAGIPHADRLVFTFISTGVYDNYYDHTQLTTGGLYYQSNYGLEDSANVPINAYYSHMNSSWEGMDLWRITVVADISSIDMDSGILIFSTSINDTVSVPSMPNRRDYFIRFESAVFYLDTLTDVPWYKQLYGWIADTLWFMNGTINTWFQRIDLKLDQLIGAGDPPIDLRDQEHQIQEIVTDMDDLGNRLELSGNDLNSLMPSMPTWEETGLGNLVTDYSANINSILTVFHAIYENRIITQILTFTFLFALGGFILFGER